MLEIVESKYRESGAKKNAHFLIAAISSLAWLVLKPAAMKRGELAPYAGRHVTIVLDGKQTSDARLYLNPQPYITVPTVSEWKKWTPYILADADIETLTPDSSNGLTGNIYLKREGDALIWDHSAVRVSI